MQSWTIIPVPVRDQLSARCFPSLGERDAESNRAKPWCNKYFEELWASDGANKITAIEG